MGGGVAKLRDCRGPPIWNSCVSRENCQRFPLSMYETSGQNNYNGRAGFCVRPGVQAAVWSLAVRASQTDAVAASRITCWSVVLRLFLRNQSRLVHLAPIEHVNSPPVTSRFRIKQRCHRSPRVEKRGPVSKRGMADRGFVSLHASRTDSSRADV